jgi:hypothetical protein
LNSIFSSKSGGNYRMPFDYAVTTFVIPWIFAW